MAHSLRKNVTRCKMSKMPVNIDKKNLVRLKERYEVKFCIDHHPDSRIDTTPYLYGLRLQEIRNAISNANKGRTPYAKEGKPQQVIYEHGDTVKYVDAVTLYFDKVCPPADVDPQAPPAVIVLDKRGDETIEGQEWGFQPEIQKFMLSQKPFAEALNAACNIVMRTDLLTCNDQKLDIMERVAREREADVERLRSNLLELRKVGFDWAAIKAMISENTEEKFVVAWQRWIAFVWRSVDPMGFYEHWIPLRPHARGVSLGPFHHPWVPKVEERIMFVCYAVTPGDIPASRGISFPMLIASSADWVSSSAVGVSSCTAYSDSCLSTWRAHPP